MSIKKHTTSDKILLTAIVLVSFTIVGASAIGFSLMRQEFSLPKDIAVPVISDVKNTEMLPREVTKQEQLQSLQKLEEVSHEEVALDASSTRQIQRNILKTLSQ